MTPLAHQADGELQLLRQQTMPPGMFGTRELWELSTFHRSLQIRVHLSYLVHN